MVSNRRCDMCVYWGGGSDQFVQQNRVPRRCQHPALSQFGLMGHDAEGHPVFMGLKTGPNFGCIYWSDLVFVGLKTVEEMAATIARMGIFAQDYVPEITLKAHEIIFSGRMGPVTDDEATARVLARLPTVGSRYPADPHVMCSSCHVDRRDGAWDATIKYLIRADAGSE